MQIQYKLLKWLMATMMLSLLISCGGGGGGGGAAGDPNPEDIPVASGDGVSESPVQLTVGQARSASIGLGGKSYYYFNAAPGSYTISLTNASASVGWTLYSNPSFTTSLDSCGIFTSTKTCFANVATGGSYYIMVVNYSFSSGTYYTITVTAGGGNEGTISNPITLPVGAGYSATIDNDGMSYYSFVAVRDGSYTVSLTNTHTDLEWALFSNPTYTSYLVFACDTTYNAGNETCSTPNLVSGTTYYLRVESTDVYDDTYTITVDNGASEGSTPNPVQLTVGEGYAGSVAGSPLSYGYSYYRFTTDSSSTSSYKIDLSGATGSLGISVFSDPLFSNEVKNCYGNYPCTISALFPNTSYYLKLTNWEYSSSTYTITVTLGTSEGAPNSPVTLTLGQSRSSTVDTSSESYYAFTTGSFSGAYAINLTNTQTNLSWSLYENTGFTVYSMGSGCNNVQTAGAGDEVCMTNNLDPNTTYYLKVSNAESAASTFTVVAAAGDGSEGSINYPVVVGTSYEGAITSHGQSYYQFTTGSKAVAYLISLTNMQTGLKYRLFRNPDFTNEIIMGCLFPTGIADDICSTTQTYDGVLNANTTYYLRVEGDVTGYTDSTYTLKVEPLDPAAGCSAGSECLDFESGGTTAFILTSTAQSNKNATYWYLDSISSAGSGTSSVRSGTLATSGITTCIAYTRTGAANTVLFSLKTDNDTQNRLVFMIDGQGWGDWSGATPWMRAFFRVSLDATTHTYAWCYEKNFSSVAGSDSVSVDDIEFR